MKFLVCHKTLVIKFVCAIGWKRKKIAALQAGTSAFTNIIHHCFRVSSEFNGTRNNWHISCNQKSNIIFLLMTLYTYKIKKLQWNTALIKDSLMIGPTWIIPDNLTISKSILSITSAKSFLSRKVASSQVPRMRVYKRTSLGTTF